MHKLLPSVNVEVDPRRRRNGRELPQEGPPAFIETTAEADAALFPSVLEEEGVAADLRPQWTDDRIMSWKGTNGISLMARPYLFPRELRRVDDHNVQSY